MPTWTLRLGMSLMVVLCFWADRLHAQVTIAPPGEQVFVVPTVPYEPARLYPGGSVYLPPPPMPPANHRVQHLFNQHGMGCQSNAPWGACGNYHYDFFFIFGSCRSFFGEGCAPNPPLTHKYFAR